MKCLSLVVLFFSIAHTNAATILVGPGSGHDHPSLTSALSSARSGDVILLASGTYTRATGETFPINLKSGLTIRPATQTAKPTLSAEGNGQILAMNFVDSVTLEGVTLTGGNQSIGAALNLRLSTRVFIRDCTFTENEGRDGVGFYSEGSIVSFSDCTIENNQSMSQGALNASAAGYSLGGEIHMEGCTIRGNRVIGIFGSLTGGLNLNSVSTLRECRFLNNFCTGWSGALYVSRPCTLERCLFVGNVSAGIGGAMYAFRSDIQILDCEFYDNSTFRTEDSGGAVHIGESTSRFERCRFIGNFSGWAASINHGGASVSEIENCLFVGNLAVGTAGVGSREHSHVSISQSTFHSNYSLFRSGVVTLVEEGHAHLSGCLANGTLGFEIVYEDDLSSATVQQCLFFNATRGFLKIPGRTTPLSLQEAEETYSSYSQNLGANPLFPKPATGTWDSAPVYDERQAQSTLFDFDADWQVNSLGSGLYTLLPGAISQQHFDIVSNSTQSLTVWGDLTGVAMAGGVYELHEIVFPRNAPQVDAGQVIGPSVDLLGNPRPVDVPYQGRDSTGTEFDIGALELQYTSPFLNPRSDINRDGRVDSRDLLILEGSLAK